ncbi:PAQR family membrane homeostasis protein TrhA [Enterovirga rhinocerotis]|uniref:Hemolysin III n=1 Tax=Enterovirga rhinocerotis TaxID=1339210 RepID=A0A4R7C846_9HYPH|nr:hemolysin III family protein [Enterovirga rhinocerotis]TDR93016.1 hemolysin III [Enterovirga rhinocerotis]
MFDADGRPLHVAWRYSRAELIADGVVHAVGLVLALGGAAVLIALAALRLPAGEIAAVVVYAAGLVMLLAVSAAYNMWPISPTKWRLRRVDHASIFILIAATYTPFMTRVPSEGMALAVFVGVWVVAIGGAALKLALPGRFDRAAIAAYLLLGFSGVLAWETVAKALSTPTLVLMVVGGLTYAAGIVFHVWHGLRFQNAVWHGFVLVASAAFYSAVLVGVVLA